MSLVRLLCTIGCKGGIPTGKTEKSSSPRVLKGFGKSLRNLINTVKRTINFKRGDATGIVDRFGACPSSRSRGVLKGI